MRVLVRTVVAFVLLVALHASFTYVFGALKYVNNAIDAAMQEHGIYSQDWSSFSNTIFSYIENAWSFYVPAAALALLLSLVVEATRRRPEEVEL